MFSIVVCSDEGLTLEMSAKHHIPQAKNMPYQPLLTKPIFSVLTHEEKQLFSKLVFQRLDIVSQLLFCKLTHHTVFFSATKTSHIKRKAMYLS